MARNVLNINCLTAGLVLVALTTGPGMAAASTGDLRLVDAAEQRDIRAVRALVEKVDVNASQPDGATALQWAVHWDDREAVDLLLDAGADVNATNEYGVSPLALAALNGSATVMERLITAGADVNHALPSGETILMTAARTGNVNAVRALLKDGASIDASEVSHGQTALMWAVAEDHVEIARELIGHGADVQARSAAEFTPLMFAAREGNPAMVKLLLDSGADVNATATEKTVARWASTPDPDPDVDPDPDPDPDADADADADPDVDPDADADEESPRSVNALLVATVRGHVPVAELLLEHGADAGFVEAGYGPLHWASGVWESLTAKAYGEASEGEWAVLAGIRPRDEKLRLVAALLEHGADPNAPMTASLPRQGSGMAKTGRQAGATPFLIAAASADLDVMRLLLEHGADAELVTEDGNTALIMAAGIGSATNEEIVPESDRVEALRFLFDAGARLDDANELGETALHGAVYGDHVDVIQFLADAGANLNLKNKVGQTPLGAAEGRRIGIFFSETPDAIARLRQLGAVSEGKVTLADTLRRQKNGEFFGR